jgi:hypothetical protein
VIDNPIDPLKFIQNRIYQRLLQPLIWPEHIYGGIKGKSLIMNVTPHLRANVIVTLDIKNFFPSITTFQIYNVWSEMLGCSPDSGPADPLYHFSKISTTRRFNE